MTKALILGTIKKITKISYNQSFNIRNNYKKNKNKKYRITKVLILGTIIKKKIKKKNIV